ncbi:MAG: DUF362 domain-containing protein [Phycisphaerae bacterium]|jgi:uncharacterized protein (DUF362 family)|nr:DUF362 domain-containing protein [Phycisphaerae bacterium]
MSIVAKIKFTDYVSSVAKALDTIGAAGRLPDDKLIIIKPNLTLADAPPVTTNLGAARAVLEYCRAHTSAELAIGEGCGSGTTDEVFQATGYADLAGEYDVRLIDFNTAESVKLSNPNALQLKEFHLPVVVQDAFVISLPVLKDHCFTVTTIALKNMFGLAPGRYYQGCWNKSQLHSPSTHKSVFDVCLYKAPDLSVVDATVALTGMHLSGTPKNLGLILASFDPVAVDAVGSELLGHDPAAIEYLQLADGSLGSMDDIQLIEA